MAPSADTAYRPRIADAELRVCLAAAGAVVIEGPKACGKTRMAQQLAASTVLLEEWQVAHSLWNQVRRAVDAAAQPGQFLLHHTQRVGVELGELEVTLPVGCSSHQFHGRPARPECLASVDLAWPPITWAKVALFDPWRIDLPTG